MKDIVWGFPYSYSISLFQIPVRNVSHSAPSALWVSFSAIDRISGWLNDASERHYPLNQNEMMHDTHVVKHHLQSYGYLDTCGYLISYDSNGW